MPSRKTKPNINVFNDPTESPERVLRSSKRKRPAEEPVPTAAPKLKLNRSALGSKSANSTQNSISPEDVKKEEILAGENPLGQSTVPTEPSEPDNVFAIFMKPGPIREYFAKKLDSKRLKAFFEIVKDGAEQTEKIARLIAKFGSLGLSSHVF